MQRTEGLKAFGQTQNELVPRMKHDERAKRSRRLLPLAFRQCMLHHSTPSSSLQERGERGTGKGGGSDSVKRGHWAMILFGRNAP